MIPINSRCLKEQEDSKQRIYRDSDNRISQPFLPDYCQHHYNPIDYYESLMKCHIDGHESQNFLHVYPEDLAQRCQNIQNHCIMQNYYDHGSFHLKGNWYVGGNNNSFEDIYNVKIKRQEYDQQKLWPSQIKDEQSPSANHEHGFQTCEVPKQQEIQHLPRCSFQDPKKFLGAYLSNSREQKRSQRKIKVQAYLRKKSMRSYQKKIIYKCRKQVADNRVRYRGRFISLSQAIQILRLDPKMNHTPSQLIQKIRILSRIESQKQKIKKVKQQFVGNDQDYK